MQDLPPLLGVDSGIALITLTALEVVLGIDNIVFLSIVAGKLPVEQRAKARQVGLALAMLMRILLLLAISWVMGLSKPLFGVFGKEFSGRDIILFIGGLFLLGKATFEIHDKVEGDHKAAATRKAVTFRSAIAQMVALDLVFSLDSVITAVGMARRIEVMIAAVIIAVAVMMVFAGRISRFIERHPTLKMLALAFLLLIGVMLVAEGFGVHVGKGYIYFAMAFSLFVELLNLRVRHKAS